MATVRQPFAPLDGARLQNLTSIKNRQNAISPPSAGKRKAELLDADDFENVDPLMFSKRPKGSNSDYIKPSNFVLKRALPDVFSLSSPIKSTASPRRTLTPKSPIAKLNTAAVAKSSPIVAPAGRSPTHGKRSGLLGTRRRASGPFARVDPPAFNLGAAADAPFSLDAALKGTIPSYTPRQKGKGKARQSLDLIDPKADSSWFFDIHEDSPEQEMTNLLQHSTCVLDISSDEESARRSSREREDGRDKENVPPPGDVSQTSSRRVTGDVDDMIVEKQRTALGEMDAADFYPEGVDAASVIVVPADDEEAETPIINNFKFAPQMNIASVPSLPDQDDDEIELLMSKPTDESSSAAVLQPIEGTGESFDLWESESAHDDEPVAASA